MSTEEESLALPSREQAVEDNHPNDLSQEADGELTPTEEPEESQASTIAVPSDAEIETPSTSHPPSEADLVHPTTSSAMLPPAQASSTTTTTKHTRNTTKPAVPLIPIRSGKAPSAASTTQKSVKTSQADPTSADAATASTPEVPSVTEETPRASPPKPAAPKSWAELLRAKNAPALAQLPMPSNGVVSAPTVEPTVSKSNSLADVLASFSVDSEKKVTFLEPRGLVNTGNLCYMNSVSIDNDITRLIILIFF